MILNQYLNNIKLV